MESSSSPDNPSITSILNSIFQYCSYHVLIKSVLTLLLRSTSTKEFSWIGKDNWCIQIERYLQFKADKDDTFQFKAPMFLSTKILLSRTLKSSQTRSKLTISSPKENTWCQIGLFNLKTANQNFPVCKRPYYVWNVHWMLCALHTGMFPHLTRLSSFGLKEQDRAWILPNSFNAPAFVQIPVAAGSYTKKWE